MSGCIGKVAPLLGSLAASFIALSVGFLHIYNVDLSQSLESIVKVLPLHLILPVSLVFSLTVHLVTQAMCKKRPSRPNKKAKKPKKSEEPVQQHRSSQKEKTQVEEPQQSQSSDITPPSSSHFPVSTHAVRTRAKAATTATAKTKKAPIVEKSPVFVPSKVLPLVTQNAFTENSRPVVSHKGPRHEKSAPAPASNATNEKAQPSNASIPTNEVKKNVYSTTVIPSSYSAAPAPKPLPVKAPAAPVRHLTDAEIADGWQSVSKTKQGKNRTEEVNMQPVVHTSGRFDAFLK